MVSRVDTGEVSNMELLEAKNLARSLMDEWGLQDWGFRFSVRSVKRFGVCRFRPPSGHIELSSKLTQLNDREAVEDVIRHEIAHALAGARAGHGHAWKLKCIEVGAKPERCYNGAQVEVVPAPYLAVCDAGCEIKRHRRGNIERLVCRRHRLPIRWVS